MKRELIKEFIWDERGLAAEFALVVPLLLLFVLGTIDIGYYAYRINQAEKATQMGARWAAVTDPLAEEILTETLVGLNVDGTLISQGDRIPVLDFTVSCNDTSCSCTGDDCDTYSSLTHDPIAFNNLATWMKRFYGGLTDANIVVDYSGSGLGFAGDPNGPDIAPLITVRLIDMSYTPITLSPIGGTIGLPDFAYSITAEDASGTASN